MKSIMYWIAAVFAFLFAVFYGYGGSVTTDNLTVNQTATFYGEVNIVPAGTATTNGLVLYYNFDTNTTPVPDLSGNSNTGGVSNAVWTSSGEINGAYDFDGTNGWLCATNTASINMANALTVAAWVCPDISNSCMNVVSKSTGNGGTPFGWLLDLRSSKIYPVIKNVSGTVYEFAGSTVLSTGQWNHIAITYDGTNLCAYLNGVSDGSTAASGDINTSGNYNLGVGWLAQSGVTVQHFNGRIDDVKLYNRALTSGEIAVLATVSNASAGRLTAVNIVSSNSISQSSSTATNTFMGRVGVGTNIPATNVILHVNGDTRIDGTLKITNSPVSSDNVGNLGYNDSRYARLGADNNAFTGSASFSQGISFVTNLGDVGMGIYTNRP